MTERVARIVWLSEAQGGRKSIPSGPHYSSPVCFESSGEVGASGANWSLVIDRVGTVAEPMIWIATVKFLFPEAPGELLREGARFSLYEGKKCVANGIVIPETIAIDNQLKLFAAHVTK